MNDDWGLSGVQSPTGVGAGAVGTVAATGGGAVAGAIAGLFFLAPVGFVVGYLFDHPGTGALIGIGAGALLGASAAASG